MAEILTFEKKYEEISILLCQCMTNITLDYLLKVMHFFVLWRFKKQFVPHVDFFSLFKSPRKYFITVAPKYGSRYNIGTH